MKYVLLIFSLGIAQFALGQTKDFLKILTTYNAEKNFNGAAIVATNGQIDFIGGIGIANRQTATPITPQSKFKIASITKTFTAVLIMKLYEQGQLDLTATIGKYLPDYVGEAKNKTTIHNLLTYSSGIPNCEGGKDMEVYQKPRGIDDFIAKYCSGKLESEPGKQFSYNNGDYILLGRIIEKITGKTFNQYLKETILTPLKMNNTEMLFSKNIVNGLVNAYVYNDSMKIFYNEDPYFIENFYAAGAMYSTVEDLLSFDKALFSYKLLKKESVELMLKPNKQLGDVGLGFWYTDGYGDIDTPYVYRPGGILGSTTNWIHVLNNNRTIIVFSNTDATNLFELSQQLYKVLMGR